MDKAFRYSLRIALVLCIAAGVGLIIYSTVSPGQARRPVGNVPAPPGPPAQPAAPTPATAPPTPASTDAAPEAAATPPRAGNSEISLAGWKGVFVDPETQRKEGEIQGRMAVLRGNTAVDIIEPILELLGEVDVQLGSVRVTAKNGSVDKDMSLVRLVNDVRAVGKDFEIRTDEVLYNFADRALTSDGRVEIRKDNVDAEGVRTPALELKGQGLSVDMTLQSMKILSDAEAHIFNVSPDFLAAGGPTDAVEASPTDVIITSEGGMLYQHAAYKVVFTKNVRAVYGDRTLTCDELTIQLGRAEGRKKLEVSDMFASGNVELSFQDQVATGQSLEWHNVTQSGTLVGQPCQVRSPEFRMVGDRLTFYRLNSRFDAKGPGQLFWGEGTGAPTPPPAGTQGPTWQAGPLNLRKDAPVHIQWTASMSYDVPARFAVFAGDVAIRQEDSSLTCDQLKLNFRADSPDVESIVATGNVSIRDAATENGRDISCQELTWNAETNTVELNAERGQTVNITQGRQSISSARIVFNNNDGSLQCPAAGSLVLEPEREPGAGADALPTTVEWQDSMRFVRQPLPLATFAGSVIARHGEESMQADRLRIEFDADMAPARIIARGGALIDVQSDQGLAAGPVGPAPVESPQPAASPDSRWRLTSDSITIEPAEQVIRSDAPGTLNVIQAAAVTGTISWQRSMQLDSAASTAAFEGSVAGDMAGAVLRCEKLTVSFDEARRLRHAHAEGNVQFDATGENPWQLKSNSADAVFAGGGGLRQFIARGDANSRVEVSDENRTLRAQRLTLFLDTAEEDSRPTIVRAIAEVDVTVDYNQEPKIQGSGDRLEWDRESDTYTLTGDPRAQVRRGGLPTSSRKIVISRPTGKTVGRSGN